MGWGEPHTPRAASVEAQSPVIATTLPEHIEPGFVYVPPTPRFDWREHVAVLDFPNTSGAGKALFTPICPDLLRYEDVGMADNLRGRVVRGFFWLIRWWH